MKTRKTPQQPQCKYCHSEDIEYAETLITQPCANDLHTTIGVQVMCNDCQAEYTVYAKTGALYAQANKPVNHQVNVRETPFALLMGLKELEEETLQTATA